MQLEKYMRVVRCPTCQGQRLNPQARAVRVGGKTLVEVVRHAGRRAGRLVRSGARAALEKSLTPLQQTIAGEVLKEIRGRLGFLLNVGLHYLTLDRSAPTLSGGEAQRIRLAGQIGCGLVGVLYILDEPSIGLHPRDNDRLLRSLERLRDMGNTVVVVEHDEDTMRAADYLVDFGPGPGVRGGEVVAAGTYARGRRQPGQPHRPVSLRRQAASPFPTQRRPRTGKHLTHRRRPAPQPQEHHRRDPARPVRRASPASAAPARVRSSTTFSCEGAAGERRGASPQRRDDDEDDDENGNGRRTPLGDHDRIAAREHIDKVIDIDQSPIGRTPRSNPATYIKVFDEIRALFAEMPEAKVRGYKPGRFSFNKPGGRCEACEGNGSNRLEMDFLADVWVTCPVCEGRRFNRETLQVRFKGKNIHDVLEMDVQEALEHFQNVPQDPRHAANAARRRPRLHQARPAVARPCPAARPSASSWPANCAAAAPARRSTSSTSRPPACTSTTFRSCCRCCTASSTPATRSSSSSTTWM